MSETQTLLLGFIAGVTILLGLPVGRMRAPRPGLRQFLNALAIGILLFLIWDVLVHAYEPLDTALGQPPRRNRGDRARFSGTPPCSSLGISVGLLSLVYYERWLRPGAAQALRPGSHGPGRADRGQGGHGGLVRRPAACPC